MADHLSTHQLDRYRQGTMVTAELVAAFEHAAACRECRERMARPDQLWRAFAALGPDMCEATAEEDFHLLPDQIAEFVDGGIDVADREIAESHLEFCTKCQAKELELRDIRIAVPSSRIARPVINKEPGRWPRFVAFWSSPVHRIPFQIAGAAALLIILLFTMLALRSQVADLRVQVAELQQRNETLETQVNAIPELRAQLAEMRQSQALLFDSSDKTAVALFDGGRLVALDKQGNLTGLESLSASVTQLVKSALTTERVKRSPALSDILGKREELMGGADGVNSFALLGPVGTVLQTDRPVFHWGKLTGATIYVVTVYDSASNEVATSPRLSGTEWVIPNPLKRGGVYSWEVVATKDGKEVPSPRPPEPQAKFKLLEQATLDELDRAKHSYPDSHLILGLLYTQAGLLEDGERELKALVDANPHSAVAQKLLASTKSLTKQ